MVLFEFSVSGAVVLAAVNGAVVFDVSCAVVVVSDAAVTGFQCLWSLFRNF